MAAPTSSSNSLVEECRRAGQETSAVMEDAAEKAKATLKERGMTIVEDVDKDAFRKAGQKAYEVLNLVEAKAKVHKEIGR